MTYEYNFQILRKIGIKFFCFVSKEQVFRISVNYVC